MRFWTEFFDNLGEEVEPAWKDGLLSRIITGSPVFDTASWGSDAIASGTNCLSYAYDLSDKGPACPGYMRVPSLTSEQVLSSGKPYSFIDQEFLSAYFVQVGLIHDGLTRIRLHEATDQEHVVAVFFNPQIRDFHAVRRDKDGSWSSASRIRADGRPSLILERYEGFRILECFNLHSMKIPRASMFFYGYSQFLGVWKMPENFLYHPALDVGGG